MMVAVMERSRQTAGQELEQFLIWPHNWKQHSSIPKSFLRCVEQEPMTGIGFTLETGYFVLASGQGPFVVVAERGEWADPEFDRRYLFTGTALDHVPPITDPLGKHWTQPERAAILMDDHSCMMSEPDFHLLSEYSSSLPSGTYAGKLWKGNFAKGWFLGFYGEPDAKTIPIYWREILNPPPAKERRAA